MSIISQQLIGSGNFREFRGDVTKDPFQRADPEAAAPIGFGGYTYAKDPEQNSVFGYSGEAFSGARWSYFKDAERSTKYGGESGSRPMQVHNTFLGQMAQYTDPHSGSHQDTWGSSNYAKKIAHTIMSSGQMRSLNDTSGTATATPGRPIYNSSGGAFTGYDERNRYDISNLTTKAVEEVKEKKATQDWTASRMAQSRVMNDDGVEAVEGVEASNQEIFRATNDINTGLRQLPVAPTAQL